jgi:hypothetical protein
VIDGEQRELVVLARDAEIVEEGAELFPHVVVARHGKGRDRQVSKKCGRVGVSFRVPVVRHVAGDHDEIRGRVKTRELVEGAVDQGARVDPPVGEAARREKVKVGDVRDQHRQARPMDRRPA